MVAISPSSSSSWRSWAAESWLVLVGFAALAIPTAGRLADQVWSREWGAHGPIVLFTGVWLVWRQAASLRAVAKAGDGRLACLALAGSLLIYVFGRAYDFVSLEAAGLYGACVSYLYAIAGFPALRLLWFPLVYFAFMIPLPGWAMDQATAPLKLLVSQVTTSGLQMAGIPVFREGVTLMVAHYQLLVEDACSGLNSLTGLTAISLFYIYLLRNASWRYSLVLVALVVPIAVTANIVRVAVLVLLTYYFGDGVAQGFLHNVAGLLLFVTALLLVFVADHTMAAVLRASRGR